MPKGIVYPFCIQIQDDLEHPKERVLLFSNKGGAIRNFLKFTILVYRHCILAFFFSIFMYIFLSSIIEKIIKSLLNKFNNS